MKTEEELSLFYESKLKNILEPLERYRKEGIINFKKNIYIALSSSALILTSNFTKIPIIIFVSCIPLLIFSGIAFSTLNTISNHLSLHFKKYILHELLSFLFDKYEYIPRQKIAPLILEESKLHLAHST